MLGHGGNYEGINQKGQNTNSKTLDIEYLILVHFLIW